MNSKTIFSPPSSRLSQQLKIVSCIFIVVTVIEVINLLTGRVLNQFGNIPRYVPGLKGTIFDK